MQYNKGYAVGFWLFFEGEWSLISADLNLPFVGEYKPKFVFSEFKNNKA